VKDYSQTQNKSTSMRKSSANFIIRTRKSRRSVSSTKKKSNQGLEKVLQAQQSKTSCELEDIYNLLFYVLEKKIKIQLNRLDKKGDAISKRNGKMLDDRHNRMVQMEKRFGKNRVLYFKENTVKKIGKVLWVSITGRQEEEEVL
jgi:hypothetical protein